MRISQPSARRGFYFRHADESLRSERQLSPDNISRVVPFSKTSFELIEVFLLGVDDKNGGFLYNQLKEAGESLGIKITEEPLVIHIPNDLNDEDLYNFLLDKMNQFKEKSD